MLAWLIAVAAETTPPDGEALRWGSTLDWALTLTIVVSGVILIGILISRIVYRGNQTERSALWLHLLSLGIFPLFLLAVGNFAVLEYAKEVRFCGTCHVTMKSYIDDLHNAKSQSLAALHAQNRFAPGTECYSCHANYGLHGTVEAKMTGLRHVYKYVTGTYHLPLTMPKAFENTFCLKCHNGAKRFMAQDVHLEDSKLAPALRTGETPCVECHAPAHATPRPKQAEGRGK